VAMVQGDEPLLMPDAVSRVVQPLLDDPNLDVVNLLSPLESSDDYNNPNIVKAVCNRRGDVIYLTRAPIPYFRNTMEVPVYRQTGIMAFRAAFLPHFSALAPTPLEQAESVDMLRALEHGIRIAGVVTPYNTIGVDRPSDVPIAESHLKSDMIQARIFKRINT